MQTGSSPSSPSSVHMALNYWFHPPDVQRPFESPYSDPLWERMWARHMDKHTIVHNAKTMNSDSMTITSSSNNDSLDHNISGSSSKKARHT